MKVILEEEVAVLQISWDDFTRELVNKAHAAGFKVVPQVENIEGAKQAIEARTLKLVVMYWVSRCHLGGETKWIWTIWWCRRFAGMLPYKSCC